MTFLSGEISKFFNVSFFFSEFTGFKNIYRSGAYLKKKKLSLFSLIAIGGSQGLNGLSAKNAIFV